VIYGTVTGPGALGVAIALSGAATNRTVTDGAGRYGFSGLGNGNYSLSGSKPGLDLSPQAIAVTLAGADAIGKDFTATCSASTSACGSECVDLLSAGAHCGACGHDCGGGGCVQGACQPMVVRDGLEYPVFDIDATNVYFHTADKILSCPLAGCSGGLPRQIGAIAGPINPSNVGGVLLVSGGNVFFLADDPRPNTTGSPYLLVCSIASGCATPPAEIQRAGLQSFSGAFAVDGGSNIYFGYYRYLQVATCATPGSCNTWARIVDSPPASWVTALAADASGAYFPAPGSPTTLQRCPGPTACTPITVGTVPAFTQVMVRNGTVYLLVPGREGYSEGRIVTCPAASTSCTAATFVGWQSYPQSFTVDATAVSWFNRDASAGGASATMVTCPNSGCTSGPRVLAAGQTGAYGLRSDDRFVYWATPTQILRVAK
jgi:hypothetical protein